MLIQLYGKLLVRPFVIRLPARHFIIREASIYSSVNNNCTVPPEQTLHQRVSSARRPRRKGKSSRCFASAKRRASRAATATPNTPGRRAPRFSSPGAPETALRKRLVEVLESAPSGSAATSPVLATKAPAHPYSSSGWGVVPASLEMFCWNRALTLSLPCTSAFATSFDTSRPSSSLT